MSFTLALERYKVQNEREWPCRGRSILSQYDNETIIVYRILCKKVHSTSKELNTCGPTDIDKEVVDDARKVINSGLCIEASACSELDDSNDEDETDDCKEVKESTQINSKVEEVELCSERLDAEKEDDECSNRYDGDKAQFIDNIEGNKQFSKLSSQRDETIKYGLMGKCPH